MCSWLATRGRDAGVSHRPSRHLVSTCAREALPLKKWRGPFPKRSMELPMKGDSKSIKNNPRSFRANDEGLVNTERQPFGQIQHAMDENKEKRERSTRHQSDLRLVLFHLLSLDSPSALFLVFLLSARVCLFWPFPSPALPHRLLLRDPGPPAALARRLQHRFLHVRDGVPAQLIV